MYQTFTYRDKLKQLFQMVFPILVTQLGMFSMVFFNTILSGKYNAADLAGVAIGSALWNPVFTGLSGILLAVSPLAAQRLGQKKEQEAVSVLFHGIVLAVIIGVIVILIGYAVVAPVLRLIPLSEGVRATAAGYLAGLAYGIIPLFLFNVLRSFIYSLGTTRIVMVILLVSLPINLFLNYSFIFGRFGFPELGGAGAGYATSLTYLIMVGMTAWVIMTQAPFARFSRLLRWGMLSLKEMSELLKIGIPMGLSIFFESSMFAVVTILISSFDTTTIAAYQTANNIVAFLYMIPMSISIALTVLVGYEAGARRYSDAKAYSWLGVGLGIVIALAAGLIIVGFRSQAAALYSNDPAVIEMTGHFLIFALFFMVSDAIQVTALAALRGYKDVNVAFIMTLIAYWFICLPTGYLLSHYTSLGASGYWLGLTAGLLAAGMALSVRLIYFQRRLE
jgi:multidrug resistance protein, MATE family